MSQQSWVLSGFRRTCIDSLTKRDMEDGRIALFILPREKDFKQIKTVLEHVPVLDSAIRLPRQANKEKKQS